MKITKEKLVEIIREEVESKLDEMDLDEQDFFEPEEDMVIKKTNPGGVDKDGVPLKAPFPPGIKTARELIKKFPYNSDERKDYREWYKKYGPGAKKKSKGKKNTVGKARDRAIARRNKRRADNAKNDPIDKMDRDVFGSTPETKATDKDILKIAREKQRAGKNLTPKETSVVLGDYDRVRQEFNKKLGVKNRRDYFEKVGVLKNGALPKGRSAFNRARRRYRRAVRYYFDTGKFVNILKKK